MPVQDLPAMKLSVETIRGGYFYNEDRKAMVECHVDDNNIFMENANGGARFGGWLSVRRDVTVKPLIIWEHDECAFQQQQYSPKQ